MSARKPELQKWTDKKDGKAGQKRKKIMHGTGSYAYLRGLTLTDDLTTRFLNLGGIR